MLYWTAMLLEIALILFVVSLCAGFLRRNL